MKPTHLLAIAILAGTIGVASAAAGHGLAPLVLGATMGFALATGVQYRRVATYRNWATAEKRKANDWRSHAIASQDKLAKKAKRVEAVRTLKKQRPVCKDHEKSGVVRVACLICSLQSANKRAESAKSRLEAQAERQSAMSAELTTFYDALTYCRDTAKAYKPETHGPDPSARFAMIVANVDLALADRETDEEQK